MFSKLLIILLFILRGSIVFSLLTTLSLSLQPSHTAYRPAHILDFLASQHVENRILLQKIMKSFDEDKPNDLLLDKEDWLYPIEKKERAFSFSYVLETLFPFLKKQLFTSDVFIKELYFCFRLCLALFSLWVVSQLITMRLSKKRRSVACLYKLYAFAMGFSCLSIGGYLLYRHRSSIEGLLYPKTFYQHHIEKKELKEANQILDFFNQYGKKEAVTQSRLTRWMIFQSLLRNGNIVTIELLLFMTLFYVWMYRIQSFQPYLRVYRRPPKLL